MNDSPLQNKDSRIQHLRCDASLSAWLLALGVTVAAAALALLLVEAVFQRPASATGAWGGMLFFATALVVASGIFIGLRIGFGWGAICGSQFRFPPGGLVGVLAALAFWAWLWCIGAEPHSHKWSVSAAACRRHEAVFTHGWLWLWGAAISWSVAMVAWKALFPRLMAR